MFYTCAFFGFLHKFKYSLKHPYGMFSSSTAVLTEDTNRGEGNAVPMRHSGFGGLEVACWPLVPKFAGSNPAEAVGFFRTKKSSARLPSQGK